MLLKSTDGLTTGVVADGCGSTELSENAAGDDETAGAGVTAV